MDARHAAAGIALLVASSVGTRARAEGTRAHPQVTLAIDPCVGADEDEVRRIVGVELGALLVAEAKGDVTQVHVTCNESLTRVDVNDPVTGKVLARSVDLSAASGGGQPRLLALAIAELVSASWIELEANPDPRVPPATLGASPAARAAALETLRERRPPRDAERATPVEPPPEPPRWRALAVFAHRTVFADAGTASWGVGARAAYDDPGGLGARFDVLADRAADDVALGTITMSTASASAQVSYARAWGALGASAAAGLRGGVATIHGDPSGERRAVGGDVTSAWGGPIAGASVHARASAALVFELAGEAGWAAVPVSGLVDGASAVSIRGVWVGAQLGVGIFF